MTADGEHQLVHSVFNPAKPTEVCIAWSSLDHYCNDGYDDADTSCICYSSTYYVPRMWNSLADGCASITSSCDDSDDSPECQVRSAALAARTYCATQTTDYDDPDFTSAVRFASYDDAAPTDSGSSDSSDGDGGGGSSDETSDATAGQVAATPTTPATTTTDTSAEAAATPTADNPGESSSRATQAPAAVIVGSGLVTTYVSTLRGSWVFSDGSPVGPATAAATSTTAASAATRSLTLAGRAFALSLPVFFACLLAF